MSRAKVTNLSEYRLAKTLGCDVDELRRLLSVGTYASVGAAIDACRWEKWVTADVVRRILEKKTP